MRPGWTRKTAVLAAVALAIGTLASFVAPANSVAAADPQSTCPPSLSLVNGSFEQSTPLVGSGWKDVLDSNVPGWSTTEPDHEIELWHTGFDPDGLVTFNSPDGVQSAELNANDASTLYETLDTSAYEGRTVQWQLYHRGRYSSTVPDVMNVLIGSSLITMTAQNPTGSSSPAIGDTNVAWGRWTGSYTIPAGQASTVFAFQAVSSTGPDLSYGNELDDVSFGTDACVVTTKSVSDPSRTTEAQIGDTLNYTVNAENQGGNPAQHAIATDVLPMGITYTPGSLTVTNDGVVDTDAVGSYDSSTHTITVRFGADATPSAGGTISTGSSSAFSYSATVNAVGPIPISNTASVSYYAPLAESTQSSESNTVVTPVVNDVSAADDNGTTPVGVAITTPVLQNDSVTQGGASLDPSSVTVSSGPQDGTTSVNPATGAVTYDPSAGFSGRDSYQYRVCDLSTTPICASATATIVVVDQFTDGVSASGIVTPQNAPITTPISSIASTTGEPLDPTGVSLATAPTHGNVTINATTGAVTYTPTTDYTGGDSYAVAVCDTSVPEQCNSVTIPVTVEANTVTAVDDTLSTLTNTPANRAVLANDSVGVGGAPLNPGSVVVTTAAHHGTTSVDAATGIVTYTPTTGYSGSDSYGYTVCDESFPTAICASATVTITVNNVVIPGPASPDYIGGGGGLTTPQNHPVVAPFSEVASSIGAALNPAATTLVGATPGNPAIGPSHGTVAVDPNTGAVTYTPDAGYTGTDVYQLRVCDTQSPALCDLVNMSVTVQPNVVEAHSDSATTYKAQSTALEVITNDVSMSGQPLNPDSITIGSGSDGPSDGSATVDPTTGVVTYVPNPTFVGADSFDYTVCDSSWPAAVCSTSTVDITVDPAVLGYTGSASPLPTLLAGGILLTLGSMILFITRRRRSRNGVHAMEL